MCSRAYGSPSATCPARSRSSCGGEQGRRVDVLEIDLERGVTGRGRGGRVGASLHEAPGCGVAEFRDRSSRDSGNFDRIFGTLDPENSSFKELRTPIEPLSTGLIKNSGAFPENTAVFRRYPADRARHRGRIADADGVVLEDRPASLADRIDRRMRRTWAQPATAPRPMKIPTPRSWRAVRRSEGRRAVPRRSRGRPRVLDRMRGGHLRTSPIAERIAVMSRSRLWLLAAASIAAGAARLRPLRHLRRLPRPLQRAELRLSAPPRRALPGRPAPCPVGSRRGGVPSPAAPGRAARLGPAVLDRLPGRVPPGREPARLAGRLGDAQSREQSCRTTGTSRDAWIGRWRSVPISGNLAAFRGSPRRGLTSEGGEAASDLLLPGEVRVGPRASDRESSAESGVVPTILFDGGRVSGSSVRRLGDQHRGRSASGRSAPRRCQGSRFPPPRRAREGVIEPT